VFRRRAGRLHHNFQRPRLIGIGGHDAASFYDGGTPRKGFQTAETALRVRFGGCIEHQPGLEAATEGEM
jgi:hypothetical protein